jgi:hypothetical protein
MLKAEAMNRHWQLWWPRRVNPLMSRVWGMGTSASSDGQFFPTARYGEAMNMVNAKYGSVPGLKAYTQRKRPVRAIRLSVDPGDRERGTVYSSMDY